MKNLFITMLMLLAVQFCIAQEKQQNIQIAENEVCNVRINFKGQLWVGHKDWSNDMDHYVDYKQLHDILKAFIANAGNKSNLPSKEEVKYKDTYRYDMTEENVSSDDVPNIIAMGSTRHVINFVYDIDAPAKQIKKTYEAIMSVYGELREEGAQTHFKKPFKKLTDNEQRFIGHIYPIRIFITDRLSVQ